MRGATATNSVFAMALLISIHAPHAGSDDPGSGRMPPGAISIHAPHAGSDQNRVYFPHVGRFQSTLPMRGATNFVPLYCCLVRISIHAPHAGSDR